MIKKARKLELKAMKVMSYSLFINSIIFKNLNRNDFYQFIQFNSIH